MNVYKLRPEDQGSTPIDRDTFEAATRCREPWYQPGTSGKDSHFAVCPACDNPIQLIGLYELPANVTRPFGKHTTTGVEGLAPIDHEEKDNCPYFNPRQHDRAARRTRFDGVPRKIVQLLIEQFDRVVYILEKQTGLSFSQKALRGMLQRYRGERGCMYTGASLRNVPWIFAYMSNATDLFGQRVSGNEQLTAEILKQVQGADINGEGRLVSRKQPDGKKAPFFDLKVSFIHHRIRADSEEGSLTETMTMVVSLREKWELRDIHRETIEFDHDFFDRLIQLPEGQGQRRLDRVELAREELGDLLLP